MQGPVTATDDPSGGDALASRDRLVDQIVEQVERHGYFVALVPAQPTQCVIDLRWAAQGAARVLGCRMQTCVREADSGHVGLVTVVAAPVDATATIDRLLGLLTGPLRGAPISA